MGVAHSESFLTCPTHKNSLKRFAANGTKRGSRNENSLGRDWMFDGGRSVWTDPSGLCHGFLSK